MEPEGSLTHKRPPPVPFLCQISPIHSSHPSIEDPCWFYPSIYAPIFQVVSFAEFPPTTTL